MDMLHKELDFTNISSKHDEFLIFMYCEAQQCEKVQFLDFSLKDIFSKRGKPQNILFSKLGDIYSNFLSC